MHPLKLANVFCIYYWTKSVVDLDDLMSRYYAEEAKTLGGIRCLIKKRRSWTWRRRESRILERFDAAVDCSEDDRKYLGGGEGIHVVPNGFEDVGTVSRSLSRYKRLGFIGKIDYEPNWHGLLWFLNDVWPKVVREVPRVELRLIGECEENRRRSAHGVRWLGSVRDPAQEMATWSAIIVPIFKGGGTRVKIAEAFARGVPVVATSHGAFGYEVESGRELILADQSDVFVSACVQLLTMPKNGERLAKRGREHFLQKYSWEAIGNSVAEAVNKVIHNLK